MDRSTDNEWASGYLSFRIHTTMMMLPGGWAAPKAERGVESEKTEKSENLRPGPRAGDLLGRGLAPAAANPRGCPEGSRGAAPTFSCLWVLIDMPSWR